MDAAATMKILVEHMTNAVKHSDNIDPGISVACKIVYQQLKTDGVLAQHNKMLEFVNKEKKREGFKAISSQTLLEQIINPKQVLNMHRLDSLGILKTGTVFYMHRGRNSKRSVNEFSGIYLDDEVAGYISGTIKHPLDSMIFEYCATVKVPEFIGKSSLHFEVIPSGMSRAYEGHVSAQAPLVELKIKEAQNKELNYIMLGNRYSKVLKNG